MTTLSWPFSDPKYRTPVKGQEFGQSNNPAEPSYPFNSAHPLYLHYHRGVDFPCESNTTILAAGAGTVQVAELDPFGAGDNGGYGLMIGIDHGDGLATLYGHLNSISVVQGDTVTADQAIALSGGQGPSGVGTDSGNSNGAHLHFGVNIYGDIFNDGGWRNPIPYLSGNPGTSADGAGTVAPGTILTAQQAVYFARAAGFPENQLATAVAIAMAESGLRVDAVGPTTSSGTPFGLWQIESEHGYDKSKLLSDPLYSAKAAYAIYQAQGWNNGWQTYSYAGNPPRFVGIGKGAYTTYLPAARTAVSATPPGTVMTPAGYRGPLNPNQVPTYIPLSVAVSQDTSPQLPVDVVSIHPVTVDLARVTPRPGADKPTAIVWIGDDWLPVETSQGASVTLPQYRTPGSFSAMTVLSSYDDAKGQRILARLFERDKTQVDVAMGYVANLDDFDPHTLPKVFTGLLSVPEINYAQQTVSLSGPDLSGIFSEPSATSSQLKSFVNMDAASAIKKIVQAHNANGLSGLSVVTDPTAGTVGGIYGQNASQTRVATRTEWDIITTLAAGEGCVAYFSGSTLYFQRIPPSPAALHLSYLVEGQFSLLLPPRFRPLPHSKRDYLVQVTSYDTKAGVVRAAIAGNHDAPTTITINASPNRPTAQLQRRANAVYQLYQATELQADLTLAAPQFIAPAQPLVIDHGGRHQMDQYVMGPQHPYYPVTPKLSYSGKGGITMDLVCSNRPVGIQDTNTTQNTSF